MLQEASHHYKGSACALGNLRHHENDQIASADMKSNAIRALKFYLSLTDPCLETTPLPCTLERYALKSNQMYNYFTAMILKLAFHPLLTDPHLSARYPDGFSYTQGLLCFHQLKV